MAERAERRIPAGHGLRPLPPGPAALVRFKRICLALESTVAVLILEEQLIVTSDGDYIEVRTGEVLDEQP